MTMTIRRLQLVLLATSPMWLETVGLGETIDHGDLGLGARVGEAGDIPGCDPLPEDPGLIPNLQTGWARMINGKLHVLLSDSGLRCPNSNGGTDSSSLPQCGSDTWILRYDLPEEMQATGTYELSEHVVNWNLSQQMADDPGVGCASTCATMTLGASFTPGGTGPDARLEVLSINDQCITGRISELDLSGQIIPPPPQLNGSFRAVRCD